MLASMDAIDGPFSEVEDNKQMEIEAKYAAGGATVNETGATISLRTSAIQLLNRTGCL